MRINLATIPAHDFIRLQAAVAKAVEVSMHNQNTRPRKATEAVLKERMDICFACYDAMKQASYSLMQACDEMQPALTAYLTGGQWVPAKKNMWLA